MKFILSKLSSLFKPKSQLEEFIVSKNPQTDADVERWTRVFNRQDYRGL
jgi:hypothetical protein